MKLIELREEVVNLADVRKRKQVDALSKEFDQYEQLEQASGEAFNALHDTIQDQMENIRVPGFKGIDDISGFLQGDLGMPNNTWPKVWNDWLAHLPKEDVDRVKMLAHHSSRIVEKLQQILEQLNAFDKQWAAEFDKLPNAKARARVFDATHVMKQDIWHTMAGYTKLASMLPLLSKQ
jgi:hypothetical protein